MSGLPRIMVRVGRQIRISEMHGKSFRCFYGRETMGRLDHLFQIKGQRIGRITDVDFESQVQFEGYIIGLS